MSVCIKCHRPLRIASPDGYGPVCRKTAAVPVPAHERDLFGYDLDKAIHAASYRVQVHINSMAAEAHVVLWHKFAEARERLLGWEAR